ncbi:MAG TPA: hypothetical protein VKS60_08740 [Stellaceae bacterium]|nr:hypothetical protein [Stellaceae bacterium]
MQRTRDRLEFRDLAAFVHPVSRLLSVSGFVRAAEAGLALTASFDGEAMEEVVNAWVQLTPVEDGWAYFAADAILPDSVAPDRLRIRFDADGAAVAALSLPADPPEERAGLIAVELIDDGTLEIDAWSLDLAPQIVAADKPLPFSPVGSQTHGETSRRVRASAPWPCVPATVKAAPSAGWGQNLEDLERWLAPDRPSSAALPRWRDRHAGEMAWVIGSGPSVQTADLDRLDGRLTFAFNRFHLAHESTGLRPTYTVSADRQMIEDFGQDIVDRSGGTVFIASERPPDLIGDYIWLRLVDVSPPLFSLSTDRAVTPGGSSAYVAMQLAYFMGIRRLYLYGMDFRFSFERNPAAAGAYRSATGEGNHFIANYRDGRPWCPPSFRQIATSFHAARVLLESEGGFIRNATRGGALEIFPRHDFDDALEAG